MLAQKIDAVLESGSGTEPDFQTALDTLADALDARTATLHRANRQTRTLHMLAQSFLAMQWGDEAVTTFRQALDAHGRDSDDTGMEINYGLMDALLTKATDHRELDAVVEADKIASSIAIKNISFKEIRQKRDAIKKLIAELRQS